jgi:uncharacterized protein YkwD
MRAALAFMLLAVALTGCGGPGDAVANKPDVDGCAGSWLRPVPANEAQVRAATFCLVNAVRARNGVPPLTQNLRLQVAAELHSRDMAKRKYFEHGDPDGVQPDARIVHAGYPPILVGENLAWGELAQSTPANVVSLWMTSPGHRANVLERGYHEIGIGLAFDAPERQDQRRQAAIYTTTFGAGGR